MENGINSFDFQPSKLKTLKVYSLQWDCNIFGLADYK